MRAPHCADFCAAIKRIRTPVDFVNGFVSVATGMVNKRILRLIKIFTGTQTGTRDELFQLEGRLDTKEQAMRFVRSEFPHPAKLSG